MSASQYSSFTSAITFSPSASPTTSQCPTKVPSGSPSVSSETLLAPAPRATEAHAPLARQSAPAACCLRVSQPKTSQPLHCDHVVTTARLHAAHAHAAHPHAVHAAHTAHAAHALAHTHLAHSHPLTGPHVHRVFMRAINVVFMSISKLCCHACRHVLR